MSIPYRRRPFLVPNATKARKGKGIADTEFLKLPEKRRSPSARKEKAIAKSAARNAAASKKITAKEFAMPPKATQ